jgi:hypothetical protein
MKLNLTDDDKEVELPENNYNIPIILLTVIIGFITNLLMSGNIYYAFGAAFGGFIIAGIIGLIASFFTKKWIYVFAIVWLIGFFAGISDHLKR